MDQAKNRQAGRVSIGTYRQASPRHSRVLPCPGGLWGLLVLGCAVLCAACAVQNAPEFPPSAHPAPIPQEHPSPPGDLPAIPDPQHPLTFAVYGDMRFTDPAETHASRPVVRQALVRKLATEPLDALFLTGDVPWHGGILHDYEVFSQETTPWREAHLRVYPVLGNHELLDCPETQCLENWWRTFPIVQGRRWYALSLGSQIRVLGLDSTSSLLPGSAQQQWLTGQLSTLAPEVHYVLLLLHHPLIADQGFLGLRSNERALDRDLRRMAPTLAARLIVVSGHVHNYERFERGGITYVISGGGGAHPHPVLHMGGDRYRAHPSPNFHYVRFTLEGDRLSAEMVRLEDHKAATPQVWKVRDRFQIEARMP